MFLILVARMMVKDTQKETSIIIINLTLSMLVYNKRYQSVAAICFSSDYFHIFGLLTVKKVFHFFINTI